MKEQVEYYDNVLLTRIDEYLSTFPEEKNTLALYACACDEKDAIVDSVPIYKHFIEFRKILESKHQFIKFIHKHFVTNEVT